MAMSSTEVNEILAPGGKKATDEESPPEKARVDGGSMSKSNTTWEDLLRPQKFDSVLKILDSATASNHGSSSLEYESYHSSSAGFSGLLPIWMRFDEHSKLQREFVTEMRLLSRLRHPCKSRFVLCHRAMRTS